MCAADLTAELRIPESVVELPSLWY